jgi:hypothetical protein
MKSFKNFLHEFAQKPLPYLIANLSIPLDSGMMKRLGYFQDNIEAWHLTHMKYLPEMVKNQNKKKRHISAFTKGSYELARLPSQPDILLKLQGDAVIEGDTDLWSTTSVRGKRWLDIKGRLAADKLEFHMKAVLQKTLDAMQIQFNIYKQSSSDLEQILSNLSPKEFKKFYFLYLKNTEDMLNKQYKYLNKYLQTAAEMKYNELILDNWKILEIYSLPHNSDTEYSLKQKLSKLNLPHDIYAGEISYSDIAKIG